MSEYEQLTAQLTGRGLDITVPNVARIYDYFLGGKDNFEADRRAAAELVKLIPDVALAARRNRDFLGRVVEYLAGAGIRQFLDIGSGLPSADSVHQIAQAVAPAVRVVYVDYDPVVVLHSQVLLEDKSKGVAVIEADFRNPSSITGDPRVRELIDFTQPAAILMLAILHFVTDAERPGEIAGHFRDVMAPGSYLALSHITDEDVPAEDSRAAQRVYQSASAPAVPRSHGQIIQFFDGLQIVEPGLVDVGYWPEPSPRIAPATRRLLYGGVAVKGGTRAPSSLRIYKR
jgi:S-adenosyl methyltransferase